MVYFQKFKNIYYNYLYILHLSEYFFYIKNNYFVIHSNNFTHIYYGNVFFSRKQYAKMG